MKSYVRIISAAIIAAFVFSALFILNKPLFFSLLAVTAILGLAVVKPHVFKKRVVAFGVGEKLKKVSVYIPHFALKSGVIVAFALIAFLFIGHKSKAQFGGVVFDPTAAANAGTTIANQIQQLTQAAEQTQQLVSSVGILGETRDVFKKISNTIKEATMVASLLNKQANLIIACNTAMHSLDKYSAMGLAGSVNTYQQKVSQIIDQEKQYVDQLESVISDGILNMTDGERTQILNKMTEATDQTTNDLVTLQDRYQESMVLGDFYTQLEKTNP